MSASSSNQLDPSALVVGLDIGTTKVSAVVGEVDTDTITVLGVSTTPCRGLRKGVVSNIDWTMRAIGEAVEAAQTMAGVEIRSVHASISGAHVRGLVSDGVAAIAGPEVTQADVERVLQGARAIPIDSERTILHTLPREYVVDNQDGVRDPIGMSGVRLQARVNLVTAASSCVQNVVRCVERCGLEVAEIVLAPLASAEAVLSEDEKEIGVALIDLGGGTTDILLYVDGGVAFMSSIPAGGQNVTNDIASGLRTPLAEAERLKRSSGCALGRLILDEEEIEVPGVGGHPARRAPRRVLSDIIEPRIEQIFAEVKNRMERSGAFEHLASGIVLTGGSVLMQGVVEAAEEVLGLPVRIGCPIGIKGIVQLVQGPQSATGVGLVGYGARALKETERDENAPVIPMPAPNKRWFWDWLRKAV